MSESVPRTGTTNFRGTLKVEVLGGKVAAIALARIIQCAVERRRFSVGAKPTRQLSLQPVAIGAAVEVTKPLKPSV